VAIVEVKDVLLPLRSSYSILRRTLGTFSSYIATTDSPYGRLGVLLRLHQFS
jgi:hypothetical protein